LDDFVQPRIFSTVFAINYSVEMPRKYAALDEKNVEWTATETAAGTLVLFRNPQKTCVFSKFPALPEMALHLHLKQAWFPGLPLMIPTPGKIFGGRDEFRGLGRSSGLRDLRRACGGMWNSPADLEPASRRDFR
jgi:hypothetical protein